MKPLFFTCIGIICLLACSSIQPEPRGILRLQIVTRSPEVNLAWFSMPDSTKFKSGSYQMKYFEPGILIFDNVKKGQYLLKLRPAGTLPYRLDTLITFDGKDMIFLLRL